MAYLEYHCAHSISSALCFHNKFLNSQPVHLTPGQEVIKVDSGYPYVKILLNTCMCYLNLAYYHIPETYVVRCVIMHGRYVYSEPKIHYFLCLILCGSGETSDSLCPKRNNSSASEWKTSSKGLQIHNLHTNRRRERAGRLKDSGGYLRR